jgi:hypothetical protein
MRIAAVTSLVVSLAVCPYAQPRQTPDLERLPFAPARTICYRTTTSLTIDGKLDEPAWRAAAWSEPFTDIDGVGRPRLATRVKMLWDDEYFYISADLDEPDVWATLTERDSVIFRDNDFEIFIDPDGDTHAYYEIEVNALGTIWDLMLMRPYRDGGPAITAWDVAGLQTGVDVRGTLNRSGDRDEGWSVEIAVPWKILSEAAPGRRAPRAFETWRVNFSRVQWQTDVRDGAYLKRVDEKTGKALPEDNWVWSPQGAVNMHMPERWGFVQFSDAPAGSRTAAFVADPNEQLKWALRRLYYRQRQYHTAHGRYAPDPTALGGDAIVVPGVEFTPVMQATDSQYEIHAAGPGDAIVHIRQDGRTWVTGGQSQAR